MKIAKNFATVILFILYSAQAGAECVDSEFVIAGDRREATAGVLGNFWGSNDSLSAVVMEVVEESSKNLRSASSKGCGESCQSSVPKRRIKVTPSSRLKEYGEKADCQKLLERTSVEPIVIVSPLFSDKEEFGEWFASLAQGKGKEGKKLYKLCPGSCSPGYSVDLEDKQNSNYLARVSAICGHARNKSENKFKVVSEYVWSCGEGGS